MSKSKRKLKQGEEVVVQKMFPIKDELSIAATKTLYQVGFTFNATLNWEIDLDNVQFCLRGIRGRFTARYDSQSELFFTVSFLWVLVYADTALSALCKATMGLGHNGLQAFSSPDHHTFDSVKTCRVMVAGEDQINKYYERN